MIVSHDYPYLDITCWIGGQNLQGSAYVDTGFDGCLIVPEAEARKLMVPFHPTVVELGDGSLRLAHEHRGVVEIGKARFRATVLFLGNEYLAGTRSRGPDADLLSLGREAGSRVPETVG